MQTPVASDKKLSPRTHRTVSDPEVLRQMTILHLLTLLQTHVFLQYTIIVTIYIRKMTFPLSNTLILFFKISTFHPIPMYLSLKNHLLAPECRERTGTSAIKRQMMDDTLAMEYWRTFTISLCPVFSSVKEAE